jgi:hypothetical protein
MKIMEGSDGINWKIPKLVDNYFLLASHFGCVFCSYICLKTRAGSGLNNANSGRARALQFVLWLFEGLDAYLVKSGLGFFT